MKAYRGTRTETGKDSPFRTRTIEENLQLFEEMKNGQYHDGSRVLRAKIDNNSPNINMRDPTIYRIKRASHPITGDRWCIYPMYDFAHAISDALEGITHSLCTLEFADHRPLYDWVIDNIAPSHLLSYVSQGYRPTQIEFSRLNLQYTILSKRKLIQLVTENYVSGWDDPRMPTICGLRRRGYPASAIRLFCDRVGISKAENNIDISILEECVRETLDYSSSRAMVVLNPLKVTISNWIDDKTEIMTADNHPKRSELGTRELLFTKQVYIDHEDFFDTGIDGSIVPPKGFKRLIPNGIVRLKFGFVITCNEVIRDKTTGKVLELICSYDERTKHGITPEGSKKAKGIIQWVSVTNGIQTQIKLYDRLFKVPSPGKDRDFLEDINPYSIVVCDSAMIEPSLKDTKFGETYQFERLGYFTLDNSETLVFNRVVTLKDTWTNN